MGKAEFFMNFVAIIESNFKNMKNALISLALLLFASASMAQNKTKEAITEKKIKLGLLSVGQISWIATETSNIKGAGVKGGLNIGLSTDYFFNENYALSVELLHSTTGFKVMANAIDYQYNDSTLISRSDVTIDYRYRSFQIPISIKLRTNEIGYLRYFGQVGVAPSFAYRAIRANYSPNFFPDVIEGEDRLVNERGKDFNQGDPRFNLSEDNVRGIILPILLGAGAEWNISGQTSLIFGLRYEYGINNLFKAERTTGSRSCLGLTTGIRF